MYWCDLAGVEEADESIQPEDIQEVLCYLEPLARSRELRGDQLLQGLQQAEGGLAHCRLLTLLRARLRHAPIAEY